MVIQNTNIKTDRLFYIDNLRVFLIILVIVSHVSLTYGSIEGANEWYYYEANHLISTYSLTIFLAIVTTFLMGLFFLISGYFTPISYDKKGFKSFLSDRFLRLGIPLIFYFLVIGPVLNYTKLVKFQNYKLSFWNFLVRDVLHFKTFDIGPLWFVELLLIFTIIYSLSRLIQEKLSKNKLNKINVPKNYMILVFIFGLSIINFLLRIQYPLGKEIIGIEIGYMPQFIIMYVIGILAYKNDLLAKLTNFSGRLWIVISAIAILLWPVLLICGGALKGYENYFTGGLHWQAYFYDLWESIMGIGITIVLLVLFRNKLNQQNKLAKIMSQNVYAVYIIHPLVIVFLSYSIIKVNIHPLLKFVLISFTGIFLCFVTSQYIIRKIPLVRKIL